MEQRKAQHDLDSKQLRFQLHHQEKLVNKNF